jgi:multidrug efflux pump subunit AcrA (membrane-fusion protein)
MLRSIVIVLLSAAIVYGGYLGYNSLSMKPEDNRPKPPPVIKSVYAETVENSAIPLRIISSGQLVATRRVTLTSEVTGVLVSSRFKEGVRYKKDQVIFTINNSETDANVTSQRSSFYSTLLMIMPDLKLDYPEFWPKWDAYLKSIDINSNLPPLPEFTSERERNFVTANGVVAAYQNCKNLEIRSGKFVIRAPFHGVITRANVQEGGLVSQNQPLGEISSLGDYELELPVNVSYLEYLEVGQEIDLHPHHKEEHYEGRVVRINPRADVNSQSIVAYVRVISDELREGMYMEAVIDAGSIDNAYEIDRKLINTEGEIYIVEQDTLLVKRRIEPVYFKEKTAIVRGLENGTVLVSKPLPGAYPGMRVTILETPAEEVKSAEAI